MSGRPLSCERHIADMEVSPLPPVPDGDEAMVRELFTYLAQPSPGTCQRDLAIGAHVVSDATHVVQSRLMMGHGELG